MLKGAAAALPAAGIFALPSLARGIQENSTPQQRPKVKITDIRTAQVLVHFLGGDLDASDTDSLTGLCNRRAFYRATHRLLAESASSPTEHLSVTMTSPVICNARMASTVTVVRPSPRLTTWRRTE